MFDLTGKIALITGSSRGIGKAMAKQMALHGAGVVVSSRKDDVCEKVAAEINRVVKDKDGAAVSIPCNISYKDQLENLVEKTRLRFGKIDILVCNAAINPHFGPSSEISDEAFDKIMGSNIKSNHWLCNMVLPEMVERKDGVIIFISSLAGLRGRPKLSAYGITKAADMAMVRNIAVEYGPDNIRANVIAPGLIRTDFARPLWENPEFLKQRTLSSPIRRMGEPDEIAGAAIFLASAAGTFITGQTIVIDGGVSIT